MTDQEPTSPSTHRPAYLRLAYWLCAVLSVIAALLLVIYLLLLTQAAELTWNTLGPPALVAVTFAHMSILLRAVQSEDLPSITLHAAVALCGTAAVVAFHIVSVTVRLGAFYFPVTLAGCMISYAVWRLLIGRLCDRRISSQTHPQA